MVKNKLSHIALILDGNNRWAKSKKLNKTYGYKKGFDNIKKIVDHSLLKKIDNLTLFTLSSENFNRPSLKIIYELIYNNFPLLFDELINEKKVKINIFGSRQKLPQKIINIFNEIEKKSEKNNALILNIAFNYGFKEEIKEVLIG